MKYAILALILSSSFAEGSSFVESNDCCEECGKSNAKFNEACYSNCYNSDNTRNYLRLLALILQDANSKLEENLTMHDVSEFSSKLHVHLIKISNSDIKMIINNQKGLRVKFSLHSQLEEVQLCDNPGIFYEFSNGEG